MNQALGGPVEDVVRAGLAARFPQAQSELQHYAEILAGRGLQWGLLGPREADKLWGRHLANSLALVDLVPSGVSVADVGSGAGLPGLPLALVREDLQLTLIESLKRRAEFLELAVDELGLADRVRVVRGRAEEQDATFDIVTARAVAPLEKLLKWTGKLFVPQGQLLALKGESAATEVSEASSVLDRMRLSATILEARAIPEAEATRVVSVKRQRT